MINMKGASSIKELSSRKVTFVITERNFFSLINPYFFNLNLVPRSAKAAIEAIPSEPE